MHRSAILLLIFSTNWIDLCRCLSENDGNSAEDLEQMSIDIATDKTTPATNKQAIVQYNYMDDLIILKNDFYMGIIALFMENTKSYLTADNFPRALPLKFIQLFRSVVNLGETVDTINGQGAHIETQYVYYDCDYCAALRIGLTRDSDGPDNGAFFPMMRNLRTIQHNGDFQFYVASDITAWNSVMPAAANATINYLYKGYMVIPVKNRINDYEKIPCDIFKISPATLSPSISKNQDFEAFLGIEGIRGSRPYIYSIPPKVNNSILVEQVKGLVVVNAVGDS